VFYEVRISSLGAVASCSRQEEASRGGIVADPQTNKQTVLAYYNMAFNERKPAEAAKKYGAAHYIQHNPQAPTGSRRSSTS
jgi:hypothetical protein